MPQTLHVAPVLGVQRQTFGTPADSQPLTGFPRHIGEAGEVLDLAAGHVRTRRGDGGLRVFFSSISTAPALEFRNSLGSSGTGNFGFKVLTDAAYF
jgi:hypothetical protein